MASPNRALARRTDSYFEEDRYDDAGYDEYVDEVPPPEPSKSGRREIALRWMFWIGTVLAPIAALFLVLGQGVNPLRAAAALAILGVVFIGLSVTLRENSSAGNEEIAENLQEEVDDVRAELDTLRRGVQLSVSRELSRMRGELEAAQSVLRAEATRLPVEAAPAVAAAPAPIPQQSRRPAPPAERPRPDVRAAAPLHDSTGAVPVPQSLAQRLPVPQQEPAYDDGRIYAAAQPATRASVHDEAPHAVNGRLPRTGSHNGYDSLASTASHRIVTNLAMREVGRGRNPRSDRGAVNEVPVSSRTSQIVEPIRETYSSRPSYESYPAFTARHPEPEESPRYGDAADDVLFGDVLPPQRSRYDRPAAPRRNWNTSTATYDWEADVDYDFPSLDGLPIPGYGAPEPRSASSDNWNTARPVGSGAQPRRRGGGRHSADNSSDASWYGG